MVGVTLYQIMMSFSSRRRVADYWRTSFPRGDVDIQEVMSYDRFRFVSTSLFTVAQLKLHCSCGWAWAHRADRGTH